MALVNNIPKVVRLQLKKTNIQAYYYANPGFKRVITSPIRVLPDFLLIGAAKCGTSSAFHYLVQHHNIIPSSEKEIGFFSAWPKSGKLWYKSHFPTHLQKFVVKKLYRRKFITGEATPSYLFAPLVPKMVHKVIPNVKMIVLLRNPVDRAYSSYRMRVRQGYEKLSFEDAIKNEDARLEGEKEKILNDPNYYGYNYSIYSYLTRGIYVDQLKVWMDIFPKEQFLVLKTEDLYSQPQKILNHIFDFLSLPSYSVPDLKRKNVAKYSDMSPKMRKTLIEFFKPHNERLYQFLGTNFGWDR